MNRFQDDMWGTIAITVRDGFDDQNNNNISDYNYCLYFAIRHKLIHMESKLMNANSISFLFKDITEQLIQALLFNKQCMFQSREIALVIARHFTINTIGYTITRTQRYQSIMNLFHHLKDVRKTKNHWFNKSLPMQAMIYLIGFQIQKAYRQQLTHAIKNQSVAQCRLISLSNINDVINKLYFKSIMNYAKTNRRIICNLSNVQGASLSFCGNDKCKKNYIEYKYGKKKNDIMILILNGKKLKRINKWYKCKGCLLIFYCSYRCQKYHWKYGHRIFCRKYF